MVHRFIRPEEEKEVTPKQEEEKHSDAGYTSQNRKQLDRLLDAVDSGQN